MSQPLLALFCSERCPGDLIIKAGDVATKLRETGVTVISGFHSPVERESLRILLRGIQPVIVCPARSIERIRLPAEWRDPILEGRLLLISPFTPKQNRMTAALAAQRNEFVAALACAVLIIYADVGGLIEKLAKKTRSWGKPLIVLESPHTTLLKSLGAHPVNADSIVGVWKRLSETAPTGGGNECST